MKIKRTYLQLLNFNVVASTYVQKNNEVDNKLTSAIKKFAKQLQQVVEEYNDERDNLQLDNCSVDEKTKNILKDKDGNRTFTVPAEKKLKAELKELASKSVEVQARIHEGIDELISALSETEKEVFSGIVIPEQITVADE